MGLGLRERRVIDATSPNPTHVYTQIGTYTVMLIVSDGQCPDTLIRTNYIRALPCTTVTANFSAPRTGNAPFSVQFTDLSTGPVSEWQWDFQNDGIVDATVRNPAYTYTATGFYAVSLSVSDGHCSHTVLRTSYINVLPCNAIVANFAADTLGSLPFTVQFTDLSTGPVSEWQWDFQNDGIVDATVQNPTHTYTAPGRYSVKLTASGTPSGVSCSGSIVKTRYINAQCNLPVADFRAIPASGPTPLAVQFEDLSIGTPTQWRWDFENDGTVDATEQNPVHVYTTLGTHSVKLIALTEYCADTVVKLNYINVQPCNTVRAEFSADPTSGGNPLTVQFHDLSFGPVISWAWDFQNDGIVDATVRDPVHTYVNHGTYSVSLTVSDGSCTNTRQAQQYINVLRTYRDTLIVGSDHPATTDSARVPVIFAGRDSLGAVEIHLNYESAKVNFVRLIETSSIRPFAAGIRNGRIVAQWFDETGGANPIPPGRDTLFVLLLAHRSKAAETATVTLDRTLTKVYSPAVVPLEDMTYLDLTPYGVAVFPGAAPDISGKVAYWTSQSAGVADASIRLMPANLSILTGTSGDYRFPALAAGRHVLRASKADDLGGINALDGLKIVRYGIGVELLSSNQLTAAEVIRDGVVNVADALLITRVSLGLAAFAMGDWKLTPDSIVVNLGTSDISDRNFTAIRYGDVNGDWAPDPAPAPGALLATAERAAGGAAAPLLSLGEQRVAPGGMARVPIRASGLEGVGALSLRIRQEGAGLRLRRVASAVAGLEPAWHQVGNEIRIEWYDPSGGAAAISVAEGELLALELEVEGAAGDSSALLWGGATALGDGEGERIANVALVGGRVVIGTEPGPGGGSAAFALHPLAPNPCAQGTRVRFTLGREEAVRLGVYDVNGRRVRTLVEGVVGAGEHALEYDGRDERGARLGSGMYLIRLTAGGERRTRKLVVVP